MKSPLSSTTDIPAFMETPHEAVNSKAFIEASAPAHTSMNTADDFSANSANPCTIKEEELSACRKGGPTSRIRQAIFCKRRNGLFKKAHELSVLCDAEVAAVVFSTSGKKSEFASSSMDHIIKRYQSLQPQMPSNSVLLKDGEIWKQDGNLEDSEIKCLEDFQSYVFEKINTPLSINDVLRVESMLEKTLDKIHKKKMELLEMETHSIIEMGEFVCEENNILNEKLMELISTKERERNASIAWEELCHGQESMSNNLQHGLDSLQCTQEENSYSLKS